MAARELKFRSVTIYNSDRQFQIGCGSFGVVCKARCDGVLCAAKILRDLLCDTSAQPTEQFLREIQLLREINHPNIVQYLGIHRDDVVSQMPILLMELMDCNLTDYLKDGESVTMISNCEHLSVCHDIVLALVFLHFNHIIHRDLSSNNILLTIGDCRNIRTAKVGDFGMAKVYDMAATTRPNQLSTCPGTVAYMPPEALKDEPHYTEKIDCFSFGVLVIQILTRLYPNPSKEQYVPVNRSHPQENLYRLVSEVERRNNHISKIDPSNPLLSIAKACLNNNPDDRPTAVFISEKIECLKSKCEGKLHAAEHQKMIVHDPESPVEPLKDCVVENAMKVDNATRISWIDGIQFAAPCEMSRCSNSLMNKDIVYLLPVESTDIYMYDTARNQWTYGATSRYIGSSLTFINNELTTIGGKRLDVAFRYEGAMTAGYMSCYTNKLWSLDPKAESADWTNKLPSMPTKRAYTVTLNTGANLIVAGGVGGAYLTTVEVMDIEKSQWMTAADLPQKMWGASGTLCSDNIYLLGGAGEKNVNLSTVFTCSVNNLLESCKSRSLISQFTNVFTLSRLSVTASSDTGVWKQLADVPVTQATCVSVHGCVLAIGGKDSDAKPTADIHVYSQVTHAWLPVDRIPSARYSCFAIAHDNKIFVIGGNNDKGMPTSTMNVATYTAATSN